MEMPRQLAAPNEQAIDAEALVVNTAIPTVILASEGRPIPHQAVTTAARLALDNNASVHVMTIARIWGSAFGIPHPGLMPTARELQSQRDIVAAAIDELERLHIKATGEVLRSRNAAKAISNKLSPSMCLGIVMAADPEPFWLVRGLFWSHEPYRVRRLANVPVHLVVRASADLRQHQSNAA